MNDTSLVRSSLAHLDSVKQISGWLSFHDTFLLNLFQDIQERRELSGDILEIGSYMGKTAIILGDFLRKKENLYVCDVFDDINLEPENLSENISSYPNFTFASFKKNYLKHHQKLPELLRFDSMNLKMICPNLKLRIVHIDGSHNYDWSKNDIEFSRATLVDFGIIAVDDYRSPHTPGVALAVWENILSESLSPILMSANKIYLSKPMDCNYYLEECAQILKSSGIEYKIEILRKQRVLRLPHSLNLDRYEVGRSFVRNVAHHLVTSRNTFRKLRPEKRS